MSEGLVVVAFSRINHTDVIVTFSDIRMLLAEAGVLDGEGFFVVKESLIIVSFIVMNHADVIVSVG